MVAVGRSRERRYDAQNWRVAPHFSSVPVAQTSRLCMSPHCAGDVSAILTDEGSMVEWVKYSAYGVPFGLPAGDTDSDGNYDGDDKGRIGSGAYDVRKDVNLDGVEDSDDVDQGNAVTGGNHTLGRGVLSAGGVGGAVSNRRGYAGYEYAPELEGTGAAGRHLYHVRNRVYDADVGRWTRRDPLGYVDGMGLYEYVGGMAVIGRDPNGLATQSCAANSCIMYPPDSERWPGGRGPGIGPRYPGTCPEGTPTRKRSTPRIVEPPKGYPAYPLIPPNSDVDDFTILCIAYAAANPMPNGTGCDSYPEDYTYSGANARCFCNCAGSSPWMDFVRSCLQCMYAIGAGGNKAHAICYIAATRAIGAPPALRLLSCWLACGGTKIIIDNTPRTGPLLP